MENQNNDYIINLYDEFYLQSGKNLYPTDNNANDQQNRYNTFLGRINQIEDGKIVENGLVSGKGNILSANEQTVLGTYNKISDSPFIIGNGTEDNRNNLFEITGDGKILIDGVDTSEFIYKGVYAEKLPEDFNEKEYCYVIKTEEIEEKKYEIYLKKYFYTENGNKEIYSIKLNTLASEDVGKIENVLSSGITKEDKKLIEKLGQIRILKIKTNTEEIDYSPFDKDQELNIEIPTKSSDLENDTNYVNQEELQTQINSLNNAIYSISGHTIYPYYATDNDIIANGKDIDPITGEKIVISELLRAQCSEYQYEENTGSNLKIYKDKFYNFEIFKEREYEYSRIDKTELEAYNDYTKYKLVLGDIDKYGRYPISFVELIEDTWEGDYYIQIELARLINNIANVLTINSSGGTSTYNTQSYIYKAISNVPTGWYLLTENNNSVQGFTPEQQNALNSGITSEKVTYLDGLTQKYFVDLIYPIGSYYWSSNSTNPGELFGGTWEQIKDRFILAAGDTYTAGDTDGAAEYALTKEEMPAHTHQLWAGGKSNKSEKEEGFVFTWGRLFNTDNVYIENAYAKKTQSTPGNNLGLQQNYEPKVSIVGGTEKGETKPHNNMPPYLVAYCWRRTA